MNSQRRAKHDWSAEELQYLYQHYANTPTQEIAAHLGLDIGQVYHKAQFLGLSKSADYIKHARPGSQALLEAGKKFRFQKGLVPWNTGTKGLAGKHENCRKTQFKKGGVPGNVMPIGSYRVNGDGFLEHKFSETPGPYYLRWKPVHRTVWETAYGPIPQTHKVTFKPGQKTTVLEEITLDRLELLTHAELMARNSIHNYPKELVEVTRARAFLTRAIRKREKEPTT